ncbi:MAG: error-prone DNA polymerase [Akkermansiaceae bacterium]|jgi:error-prone DNA polymerase
MELLAKSSFSFLKGSSSPEALVRRAAELGHRTLGIIDHMGFYGSARAHAEAQKVGIQALVGATLENVSQFSNLTILNKSRPGYQNLSRLLTTLHCEQGVDNFPEANLTGMHAILTRESLKNPTKAQLLSAATELRDRFGPGNVSIALFRHFRRGEEKGNLLLRDLATHLKLPLLATNAPIFAHRSERLLADAFTCLREHKTLDDAGRLLEGNGERDLKSPEVIHNLFSDCPQAIHHAYELSEECASFSLHNLGYRFPSYQNPETGKLFTDREQCEYLRITVEEGLKKRFRILSKKHRQQIDQELLTIDKLGFSGYFLIVWDLVHFARSQGILCQGRGSAANSLVCYALGVTSVDPVESGLLFERFLSENRQSWPDIDIDFPSGERRESVIQYLYQKYAPCGAAMTANVITYRPRSAFREMSKVLGFPETIANRFTDLCASPKVHDASRDTPTEELTMTNYYPRDQVMELAATIEKSGIPPSHPRFEPLLHLYHAILHAPRHLGQHSGGMVFCDDGLDHIVPLQPAAMPNRTVLQWDKDDCEDLGIVKVDLLGLGMLAAMEDTLRICERRGRPVNLARISKSDPETFALLCRADTVGTFQVESRAQMATLPIMQPKTFYDVAVEVAIIRPGPIVGDLVHPYLNRRTGREKIEYIHPSFEAILKRTLGVPLFQEQVLRMAMVIADFTGVEADQLRKAMAFKRSDERMAPIIETLKTRMTERGVTTHVQERIIQSISSFALYGFPESHAISFALIAYASCWLKAHRPAEFYCGLINNQPMGFYSVNTLLQDAKRHGVRAKPVSVIHSMAETEVLDDHNLRLGLHRLKGLSRKTIERLIEQRSLAQFTSLDDFLRRVKPNVKERRILAASGSLNDLPEVEHRRDALWQAEQLPLDDLFATPPPHEKVLAMMDSLERLNTDFALQGASTGPHPMRLWRGEQSETFATSASLFELPHGMPLTIAGLVICRQRPGTAKGHCFISLEDEYGIANLFIPRKTFHQYRLTITSESFLLVRGRLQITEGKQPTVYVVSLAPLGLAPELVTISHDFH